MHQVEAIGIGKSFGTRQVLREIDLSVGSGEMFVIIGPTGSGKTTLLHILGLLESATSGRLRLLGTDCGNGMADHLHLRRRMAFVQQKPIAFGISVQDNIAQPLRWRGLGKAEVEARVSAMLQATGMLGCSGRNARTLSGGETQRLAIARALVSRPEILLLDEPTASLDAAGEAEVLETLADVLRNTRATVVCASHRPGVLSWADRVIEVDQLLVRENAP